VVLLFMALGSLAAAFWAFSPEESYIPASGSWDPGRIPAPLSSLWTAGSPEQRIPGAAAI